MTSAGPPAVHLIDASYFVFRAYYSVGLEMTDGDGQPVNALYGFGRFLGDLLEEARPEHVAVAFDESLATSFRNAIYPAYKKNREPAPPELRRQFGAVPRTLPAARRRGVREPDARGGRHHRHDRHAPARSGTSIGAGHP